MNWIGLDIGGANLKAAWPHRADCPARTTPFPMWTQHDLLEEALHQLIGPSEGENSVAVTMTGELADGFENRERGVLQIANAITRVCANHRVVFYQNNGMWCQPCDVHQHWDMIAAANWHATARWGSRFLPHRSGLVIDVGSTTTDISPVINGAVTRHGGNDLTRLANGELLYVGAGRTPICGLMDEVVFKESHIPIANELFATTTDALLWLGQTQQNADDFSTADGRPKLRQHSGQRLARMVCRDLRDVPIKLVDQIARQSIDSLTDKIRASISSQITKHPHPSPPVLTVGEGGSIAVEILKTDFPQVQCVTLPLRLSSSASVCGPAYAVAMLAKEELN